MASIRCPLNVSSITFATSGVKTPDGAGIVTGLTSAEATAMSFTSMNGSGCDDGVAKRVSVAGNGDILIALPAIVTSITINAIVYAVSGAVVPFGKCLASAVPAPAASQFLYQNFSLVQG